MTYHAEPVSPQPELGEYVGLYRRPPVGEVDIRVEDGRLMVGRRPSEYVLVFWGPDVTYATGPGAFVGMAVEFIRDESGAVTWVRVNGRIARKDSSIRPTGFEPVTSASGGHQRPTVSDRNPPIY